MAERPDPSPSLVLALRRLLPAFAIALPVMVLAAVLAVAGDTLGYDYQAYALAAGRLLAGEPLYDPTVTMAIGFGVYLYPPPFVIAALPFSLLPGDAGTWIWLVALVVAFAGGCALLPVRPTVRWLVLLLGGVSFPFVYAVKLGQVGPMLFLLAVVGWRWMDRPVVLGLSIAGGAIVKLQPALLFGWALFTRRWRAVAIGLVACVVSAAAVTLLAGMATWSDYMALLGRVSQPVTTPKNVTPGAVAYGLGASEGLATTIQLAAMAAVGLLTVWAWLRSDPTTSYVVTVAAAQLLSPVMWEHYAVMILVPVALLLERRHWWAALLPLACWLPYPAVFPLVLGVCLVAPLLTQTARQPATRDWR
jgi:hypothetical protein